MRGMSARRDCEDDRPSPDVGLTPSRHGDAGAHLRLLVVNFGLPQKPAP
jgi:hypothetical protein